MKARVLLARLDSMGDVLLTGPAVRAVADGAEEVVYLCGPRGEDAVGLLPGVDSVVTYRAPWIDPAPAPLDPVALGELLSTLAELNVDEAIIFSSFHQSALPLALLLRMAGVPVVAAVSDDYPGSLLDVRHSVGESTHEVERNLSLAATLGYRLPEDDAGRLKVQLDESSNSVAAGPAGPYVVVHPGASVPARAWPPERHAAVVEALASSGRRVVVTGGPDETALTAAVARDGGYGVVDLGGLTDLNSLAAVLAGADVVVAGNTGPAHLAAAVGTAVVSLFAPTVPAAKWHPWGVPHELLGHQEIGCAGCRSRTCPVEGHPCLGRVAVEDVVAAVESLSRMAQEVPA